MQLLYTHTHTHSDCIVYQTTKIRLSVQSHGGTWWLWFGLCVTITGDVGPRWTLGALTDTLEGCDHGEKVRSSRGAEEECWVVCSI